MLHYNGDWEDGGDGNHFWSYLFAFIIVVGVLSAWLL